MSVEARQIADLRANLGVSDATAREMIAAGLCTTALVVDATSAQRAPWAALADAVAARLARRPQ